jgi:TolB-like protein
MTEVPQVLDRFRVSRILGKGGMGTVYLARDVRLERDAAVKVLNTEGMLDSEVQARFLREARTAAAIRHQNVATIYEVGETGDGQPFIVMEYCAGETLAQRLRRKPLDVSEFLSIAQQIAAGLAAAHAQGVVHRDIKAANIILEADGQVKILDFGLAKLLGREMSPRSKESFLTTSGKFFGTLHYLAPEQTSGGPADERSDLFSVGVVFYQMATGTLPFAADAPLLVLEKIRDFEPAPFNAIDPAFPPEAAKIISKLLQKNPDDRYQSADALLGDLHEIDSPTLRATARTTLGRTVRRPQTLRIAVAFVALLVVAAATVLIRVTDSERSAGSVAPATPIRSMAVLPFGNTANSTRDDFLSVGLADALVTKLQAIPSLQVRPTSAVLEFRNQKMDSKAASKKLRVDGILEGHFLASGNLVRVNLQLTDARSGYSVWAESVDGSRDDLLKLIDEVSARTVAGLNDRLGVSRVEVRYSEPRSSNPQAYEEYLRARAMTGSFVPQEYAGQVEALKRAIELDPNFAAAYADLAIAISLGAARSLTVPGESVEKAEQYARQAVRLDPNLPQAHLALGRVFIRNADRYSESVRETLAALRLNASDTHALNSVVTYFVSAGDLQKAECIGGRILRLDPSSNEAKIRGYWYVNAVDPEGALENARWALESKDTEVGGHDMRGWAFVLTGNLTEAEREADAMTALVAHHYLGKSLRAMIAAARGDRDATEAAIRSFEDDANRNHWAAIRVAQCYARLGEKQKAVEWTRKAVTLGHHSWYSLVKHPWMQSLQTEPEFQAQVSRIKSDIDDVRDDVIGVYQLLCQGAS